MPTFVQAAGPTTAPATVPVLPADYAKRARKVTAYLRSAFYLPEQRL